MCSRHCKNWQCQNSPWILVGVTTPIWRKHHNIKVIKPCWNQTIHNWRGVLGQEPFLLEEECWALLKLDNFVIAYYVTTTMKLLQHLLEHNKVKCWIELDKQTAFLVTLPFDTSWPWTFDVTLTFNCIINANNRFTRYFINENEILFVALSQIVTKIWIYNSNRRPFWISLNYAKCSTYHKLRQVDS